MSPEDKKKNEALKIDDKPLVALLKKWDSLVAKAREAKDMEPKLKAEIEYLQKTTDPLDLMDADTIHGLTVKKTQLSMIPGVLTDIDIRLGALEKQIEETTVPIVTFLRDLAYAEKDRLVNRVIEAIASVCGKQAVEDDRLDVENHVLRMTAVLRVTSTWHNLDSIIAPAMKAQTCLICLNHLRQGNPLSTWYSAK